MNHSEFLKSWLLHRLVTVELVDMLPEGKLDFKPWGGAMTLSKLVTHLMTSGFQFSQAVKQGAMGDSGEKPVFSSITDLKKYVHEITEQTKSTLTSLTDEDLEKFVDTSKVFGRDLPGKVLLSSMRDHEIHHKGQLFIYARMTGVQNPPFFVKMGL
jgi:uncharacterized damage-inducible protein DinB